MSALSFLTEYGSNSEESDSDLDNNYCSQRKKLPVPNLSKVSVVPTFEHKDDPQLHDGRKRSFPHVRGNWATFVYVQYHEVATLNDFLAKLEKIVLTRVELCHRIDNIHVSLSKTVALKYHLITSFSSSLQQHMKNVDSFELGFTAVKIYCNEDNSRTFISLEVDPFSQKFLLAISKKVDKVLGEFQLPTFYADPSFHMSILWVNGNKVSELNDIVESMNEILFHHTEKLLETVLIDTIYCKVGNKLFQYSLS